jgi:hypothetical protein
MIALPRRFVPHALLIAWLAATLTACGLGASASAPSASPGSALSSGSETAGKPSASLLIDQPPSGDPASPVGQSETAWGRIWDRVPPWFPRYPGSSEAQDASAAASSARFAVPSGDPREIASWLRSGLETATLRTDVSGPLEDGSMTLDSVGEGTCRARTTVAPLGGMTFVTVFYGSDCPIT